MQMIKSIFNQFIIKITPLLPLWIVWKIAGRYVAGESIADALVVIRQLNGKGYSATVDILGEHTKSESEADEYLSCDVIADCTTLYKAAHDL